MPPQGRVSVSPFVAGRCAAACYYHNPQLMMLPGPLHSVPTRSWRYQRFIIVPPASASSSSVLFSTQLELLSRLTRLDTRGYAYKTGLLGGGMHCLQGIISEYNFLYGQNEALSDKHERLKSATCTEEMLRHGE